MAYACRAFIYDDTDKNFSKDLQSLRFHISLLFDIQQLLSPEQVNSFLPTSQELTDMLEDLRKVEGELKTLFKTYETVHLDIQPYSSLAEEILKRLNFAIPKLVKSIRQLKVYKEFEMSNDDDEVKRADRHFDFFVAACKECCDHLGDIKLNDHYKKRLSLLGLTNI